MADESNTTNDQTTPSRKFVHAFDNAPDEVSMVPSYGAAFACVHGLGTTDIQVSARSHTGEPIITRTSSQDDNIVVVTKRDGGSWQPGDRIIVFG